MPTVISVPDRGDNTAIVKALYPAVDASMITEMKRRSAIVGDIISHPTGRKGTGAVVDGQNTRGFDATSIRMTYLNRGAGFSFFRVL
jgi:hypothetical protein